MKTILLVFTLSLCAIFINAQTINLLFDCEGNLLNAPPAYIGSGATLQVEVDANCPGFKNQINTFIASLEKAKTNLSGTKYYEWEAMFVAYGFTSSDKNAAIQNLETWISNLRDLSNGVSVCNRQASTLCFDSNLNFNGLYYLEIQTGMQTYNLPLVYNPSRRLFHLQNPTPLSSGLLSLNIHRWDIEKKFLQDAFECLGNFNPINPNVIDSITFTLKNLEGTKDTIFKKDTNSMRDALTLISSWNSLRKIIQTDKVLSANKTMLSNLLWISQGKPTLNIMKLEKDEDEHHENFDSIAYYQALVDIHIKFKDGCMCTLATADLTLNQCACIADLQAETLGEIEKNNKKLSDMKPGQPGYTELVARNKILEKISAIYKGMEGKCTICTDSKSKNPYRPSLEEISKANLNLRYWKEKEKKHLNDKAEQDMKKGKAAAEKARKTGLPKEQWLTHVTLQVSEEGKVVWMRHHDYQHKLGLMSPQNATKNEYLENQGLRILTHNVPIGTTIVMHEQVDSIEETAAWEIEISEPLADIFDVLKTTAVNRMFLNPPVVNAENYIYVKEELEYSLECLQKEFDFDGTVPYVFPNDDSSHYYTNISDPHTTYQSPVKVSYTLTSHKAEKQTDSSSEYIYRRNKLRWITPVAILGISSVQQYEYSLKDNQIYTQINSGVAYAAGLNIHMVGLNLRNPHPVFSKKGRAHDKQPNFNCSRLSLFAGVSLIKPLRDFYIGPSLDILPGLGLTAGLNIFVQDIQRVNGTLLETFDYSTKYGAFASISITPAILLQILPKKITSLPFFSQTRTGKISGVPTGGNKS
jgi:hypothetical protein